MWWNESEPGRGYYLDVQGSTLFFTAFAYEEDGSPTFYAGSGLIVEGYGEVPFSGYPSFSDLGYVPWHAAMVELYRTVGGACLTCRHQPTTTAPVGRVWLYFPDASLARMDVRMNDGRNTFRLLTRLNYHYIPMVPTRPGTPPHVPDLMGDWLFVDMLDRSVPAWRFNFTRREPRDPLSINREPPWEVRYYDDARQARIVCREDGSGFDPMRYQSACQMYVDDEPVFWARLNDLGLDRIQAGYGAVPKAQEAYRGPGIIVGFRVE